nr:hypothetical protein [Kibdelosporangium sp. MJ126-NF4]CEL13407.1 Lipoprotein releasing system transmembrane protein LolC [Kibdelosporangium sp. MJ126-NF4]CTQ99096.1 Lipoprotein releasing system transmembrane protein LolC [Kibdelosporangium sp. MJ126-NF4]
MTLPTPQGTKSLPVLDIIDYITLEAGWVAISLDHLTNWFHRDGASFFEVMIEPGAEAAAVAEGLRRVAASAPVRLHVMTGPESVAATESAVRQVGALTIWLHRAPTSGPGELNR